MERFELTDADRELIARGLQVLDACFDDGVYHHTVGCALRCADGRIYTGVNCDGIHGSCAEYITVGRAISDGACAFDTIVAVHDKAPNGIVSPCGNCRQMMVEYCPDVKVILNDESGHPIKVAARDLLPFAWHPVEC